MSSPTTQDWRPVSAEQHSNRNILFVRARKTKANGAISVHIYIGSLLRNKVFDPDSIPWRNAAGSCLWRRFWICLLFPGNVSRERTKSNTTYRYVCMVWEWMNHLVCFVAASPSIFLLRSTFDEPNLNQDGCTSTVQYLDYFFQKHTKMSLRGRHHLSVG